MLILHPVDGAERPRPVDAGETVNHLFQARQRHLAAAVEDAIGDDPEIANALVPVTGIPDRRADNERRQEQSEQTADETLHKASVPETSGAGLQILTKARAAEK